MKKSFLVLSALLTLVVSGICLQSCSSEYDEYTTEEYGCYTEKEISSMKAIAEQYGMSVEIDENYYGKKSSLREFERNLIGIANLPGEYRLIPNNDSTAFRFVKKESLPRSSHGLSEILLPNSGSFNISSHDLPTTLTVSWVFATKKNPEGVTVTVSDPYYVQGGGNHTLDRRFLNLDHTYSFYSGGVRLGRYNIAGTYYTDKPSDFKIIKIPDGNIF